MIIIWAWNLWTTHGYLRQLIHKTHIDGWWWDFIFLRLISHQHTWLAASKNHQAVLQYLCFVDCTPFSSVWYQIISRQRAPSIVCCAGCHRDSFHKTFMQSVSLFSSTGVAVWLLDLTKGHYWFLHLFSTTLSSLFSLTVANILWREEGESRLLLFHCSIH